MVLNQKAGININDKHLEVFWFFPELNNWEYWEWTTENTLVVLILCNNNIITSTKIVNLSGNLTNVHRILFPDIFLKVIF